MNRQSDALGEAAVDQHIAMTYTALNFCAFHLRAFSQYPQLSEDLRQDLEHGRRLIQDVTRLMEPHTDLDTLPITEA